MSHARLNLRSVTSLLVDSDSYTRGLIAQMLRGFGMPSPTLAGTGKEAMEFVKNECPNLCIFEAVLPDMGSAELIRWIRKLNSPLRFVPAIVLTGYTQLRMIAKVRDGGANVIVKKPASPKVLFDHLLWLARVPRPFVETNDYVGPDRRFRTIDPPDGRFKRDSDDPELTNTLEAEQADTPSQQSVQTQFPNWVAP
jgi:CheY-like chemotaxis protein